jgi:hypothetical protein
MQGTQVSLRTKGNSVFIETIAKKEESAPDYAGENVQGGWGAKVRPNSSNVVHLSHFSISHIPLALVRGLAQIMGMKSEPEAWKPPSDSLQGVDEDEWDD